MFHREDYEILLPEKIRESESVPIILAVGPSLTMVVPILLMALLSGRFYNQNGSGYIYLSLITAGTGCVLGLIWNISNQIFRRRSLKKRIAFSKSEYERYLSTVREYLNNCVEENRRFLKDRYPNITEILADCNPGKIWKSYRMDDDYGFLRLSTGTVKFQMRVYLSSSNKEMFPSKEHEMAERLVSDYREVDDFPRGINIFDIRFLGIVKSGNEMRDCEYLLGLIIRLTFGIHYGELKIAIFYDENDSCQKNMINSVRFIPHLFDDGYKTRMLAGSSESVRKLLPILSSEKEKTYKTVFLILDDKYIREEMLYQKITGSKESKDISSIFLMKTEDMPNAVQEYVNPIQVLDEELCTFGEAFDYSRKLAGLIPDINNADGGIPENVTFESLFGVEDIYDIPIKKLWKENNPANRIRVPIGMSEQKRKIYLDVHEKFHGPHGLVAGTTGSGKSELLQTYLLSLCLSFSPNDVSFFIIDYKGGGMGNLLSKLAHCAGSVSNLSGSMINRSLLAIVSENKRRQSLFLKYKVNHIDEYMKLYKAGKVDIPVPHLILIIDEFAELKKEEPEFMKQIITLSAVGRSLGIHLILSTQKPAGIVDDKIRANSHFKLCLKVEDRQDSLDMLGRGDAAFLANPGNGYMQIGNNEFFQKFQAGYCGGKYIKNRKKSEVALLDETGERFRINKDRDFENELSKTECLVKYINTAAGDLNIEKCKSLWQDELPKQIKIDDAAMLKRDFSGTYVIGKYDDIRNRIQGEVTYTPLTDGNLLIAGNSGCGKTNILKNLVYATSYEDDIVLVDINGGKMTEMSFFKNVVACITSAGEADVLFYHLKKRFIDRKERADNNMFLLVDNLSGFLKTLDDAQTEVLFDILSEGPTRKMFVVGTIQSPGEISAKLFGKFKTGIAMQMNDRFQYCDMLRTYHIDCKIKENTPGRFLFKIGDTICECQAYTVVDEKKKEHMRGENRRKFPSIPPKPDINGFKENCRDNPDINILPIGYSLKSGYIRGFPLNKEPVLVISKEKEKIKRFFDLYFEIIKEILRISPGEILRISGGEDIETLPEADEIKKLKFLIIDDLEMFIRNNNLLINGMEEEKKSETLLEFILNKQGMFLAGLSGEMNYEISTSLIFEKLTKNGQGIFLGPGAASEQNILEFSDLGYSETCIKLQDNMGYMRIAGVNNTIRVIMPSKEKEDFYCDYD